jgi:hypothetical protein
MIRASVGAYVAYRPVGRAVGQGADTDMDGSDADADDDDDDDPPEDGGRPVRCVRSPSAVACQPDYLRRHGTARHGTALRNLKNRVLPRRPGIGTWHARGAVMDTHATRAITTRPCLLHPE